MRVWIDFLTPKQLNFTSVLSRQIRVAGHDLLLTTRNYREIGKLVEARGMEAKKLGEFGGSSLYGKLEASVDRFEALLREVQEHRPDISFSFGSPEASRISFGLGIPHFCIIDSPHAEAVCRLTLPLSRGIFTPKVIPIASWRKYGVNADKITRYDALDPVVWMRELKPDISFINQLNLKTDGIILVFRLEEQFASYLLSADRNSVVIRILEELLPNIRKDIQIVALPRYDAQVKSLTSFENRIIVPKEPIDGFSLLSYSSIFVGAGGTMTAESALMGVPTISCYPGRSTFVEQYLVRNKLVNRITNASKTVKTILKMIDHLDDLRTSQKERAHRMIERMEDPVKVIMRSTGLL